MDLSGFSTVKTTNKRKAGGGQKGQSFEDLKFRRAMGKKSGKLVSQFTVSTARFASLGLASNGLRPFINKATNQVVIGVVADADAQVLKKTEKGDKGKKFKSDTIEAALNASGIINSDAVGVNQVLKLVPIGTSVTIDGVLCSSAYLIEKGEAKVAATAAPKDNGAASNAGAAPQPVADAPAKKVWD